jgi:polar amino acid transport system substrate-binding protein
MNLSAQAQALHKTSIQHRRFCSRFGPAAFIVMATLGFTGQSYADCEITLRWDDDPPYFINDSDRVTGIDADISREAINRMGCSLSLVKMPWARALVELQEGRVDMVSSAYRTPSREEYAHFSGVVGLISPNVLFVRVADREGVADKTLPEILDTDFKLGAQVNVSYGDQYDALSEIPAYKKNFYYASRRELLWKMLARERVDGVIADELTGLYELRELGFDSNIVPTTMVTSNKPAFFIFSKKSVNPDLVKRFDQALQSMLDDGAFETILDKYLGASPFIKAVIQHGGQY